MGFWVGPWLHNAPELEYDADGKRAIVQHLCFGPVETQIWYELQDGRYICELHIAEGLQAGERFVDAVCKSEMQRVVEQELALCRQYRDYELAALLEAEQEKIASNNT